MAELVDPTQKGNYPVILGDSLLGKNSNEIFTGVRCMCAPFEVADGDDLFFVCHGLLTRPSLTDNHKPPIATAEKNPARLKPSVSGDKSSYDLNFLDKDGRTDYAYAGSRNTEGGQYVLYFDPAREAFILDRIDSTLNMNITRTPNNSDPASLRRQYSQLDSTGRPSQSSSASEPSSKPQQPRPKAKPRPKSPPRKKEPPARKSETKAKPKAAPPAVPQPLALPQVQQSQPKPPKPRSRPIEEEEEDDDDDDDGGLLVEYPGVEPRSQKRDFSPAFPSVRRFDEFMDQRESEADDADGESEEEGDGDFKLPSPVNPQAAYARQMEDDDESEPEMEDVPARGDYEADDNADMEDDLEKDLEMAFEEVNVEEDKGAESEISEED